MHSKRASRALLLCWAGLVVGCSGKPQEEQMVERSAAPLVEAWQGAGSMADTRKYHMGVVLPSGKVLVTGGAKGDVTLSSATVYDPGTGSWTMAAAMPEARESHTATVLPTGKVLVAGGQKRGTGALATAAVYDPAANTWATAGSFASGVARQFLTATLLPTGKVLVAGGGNSAGPQNKVDVYDPGTGRWSQGPNLGSARRNHTATRLASGKVLVVGGVGSSSLAAAEVYDPQSNTWTATGALTTARYDHTATLLPSGKVLVVGGRNSSGGVVGTAEEYDPAAGTWSAAGALASARELHTATLLGTGKVLVVGGLNGSSLASAELYDPATRQWSAAVSMAAARHVHVALALESLGKVLVVGGLATTPAATTGVAAAEVYAYDPCATVSCNSAPGQCYEAAGTCGNGVCSYALKAAGAACDDGDACTGTDVCDGAGVCAGSATSCGSPPGQCYEAAGTCSGGACDYAYKAAGAFCDDGDACTVEEACNGAGGCAGTPVSCTTPPGPCYEAAGTCGGGACTYPLKAGGTLCGGGRLCDAAGACRSGCWIAGAYYAAGATNPSGDCQQCNPSVSTNSWSLKPAMTQCRASAGVCDVAESCTGSSPTCPADGFVTSGTQCRASGGVCDVAESCTGTSAACPADAVASAGTACRASSGDCDVAEVCNGGSKACPANEYVPNGTSCGTSVEDWGSCQRNNWYNRCDTTGTQWWTVTSFTCVTGTCSASTTVSSTQGVPCSVEQPDCGGATSAGPWGECTYSDFCAETGTKQRQVTGLLYNCQYGYCEQYTWTESQPFAECTRGSREGTVCGFHSSCNSTCYGGGGCAEGRGFMVCSDFEVVCRSGVCNGAGWTSPYYTKCC
jgi:N-acetylneuraminic acid mutarotase